MASFAQGHLLTQKNEGGYASAAFAASIGDSGGQTYRGIARNPNPNWIGWNFIDTYIRNYGEPAHNTYINSAQLDQMVDDFYKTTIWDKIKLDQVSSQSVANVLFDIGTNSGPVTAIKSVQRVLNLDDDGIVGPNTLKAINNSNSNILISQLINYRKWWLNTYQAGKSYLPALLARVDRYSSFISQNSNIILPVLAIFTIGGIYYFRSSK